MLDEIKKAWLETTLTLKSIDKLFNVTTAGEPCWWDELTASRLIITARHPGLSHNRSSNLFIEKEQYLERTLQKQSDTLTNWISIT